MKAKHFIIYAILFSSLSFSCKNEFLDAKPQTNILAPQTINDYKALLENVNGITGTPVLGHLASDDYQFASDIAWSNTPGGAKERNSYVWAKDIFEGEINISDWNVPFRGVFYANSVIEGLEKTNKQPISEYNQIKGWALFLRAWSYLNLVCTFANNYDDATSMTDLGIPLRKTANIDEINPRATVKETYEQIINDFKMSIRLLPSEFQQLNRNRPSKSSAYAALSRTYLVMNKYDQAELYADSSLLMYDKLQDYNLISTTSATPFPEPNVETLIFSTFVTNYFITKTVASNSTNLIKISPDLISLYSTDDLRLPIYFAKNTLGNYYKKRTYGGGSLDPFSGLATDEIYLIKAECLARRNQISSAMSLLNQLLIKRYKNTVSYVPVSATTQQQAIEIILLERRKELACRGLRWLDIKRLNKLNAGIILKRTVQGTEYTLLPNDPKYAMPIPDDEINRSGLIQNQR